MMRRPGAATRLWAMRRGVDVHELRAVAVVTGVSLVVGVVAIGLSVPPAVGAAPGPVVLAAAADAYANQGAPTTNYGKSASIAARGTLGMTAYLRFAVPSTPVGYEIASATLTLTTNSSS